MTFSGDVELGRELICLEEASTAQLGRNGSQSLSSEHLSSVCHFEPRAFRATRR